MPRVDLINDAAYHNAPLDQIRVCDHACDCAKQQYCRSADSEGAHLKERLKWLAGDHLGQRAELREEAGESEGALADKLYVPVQGASQSGTLEAAAVTERKSAKRHT